MSKNSKVVDFIKRNSYYLVFVACLAILAIVTVALVVSDNSVPSGGNQLEQNGENNNQNGNNDNGGNNGQNGENNDQNSDNVGDNGEDNDNQNGDKPTVSVIVFDMPVKTGTVIKDYVGASVVYNQTLGLYTGHKAIDFSAEEGTQVYCVYNGVIESIEISKINGTSVTVDHGNGLKTVYNSIEADESLQEGATVLKGDVLGAVSTNNKTEYLDGAHLHFEVWENGAKVDPNKYLISEGK